MTSGGGCPNLGTVVSVRGSVVDLRFDAHLPPIYSLLHAKEGEIAVEILAQLDARRVRGMAAEDSGGPLKAPVGKGVLSRMFDVFGNAIDRQAAPTDVQWRTIHRDPPPLARRSTKSEVFQTGIKLVDVLVPLERGGKAQWAACRAAAGDLKLAYAQLEELETFARFGARLKQPEFSPVSVPAQIAVLLALTAALFDNVPLDQMTAAEHALREAASDIPGEGRERLEPAEELRDEDRETIIQIARESLARFQPGNGSKSEPEPVQNTNEQETCAKGGIGSD